MAFPLHTAPYNKLSHLFILMMGALNNLFLSNFISHIHIFALSRPMLSKMVATSHFWLFKSKFKWRKIKQNKPLSSSICLATFQVLYNHLCLVDAILDNMVQNVYITTVNSAGKDCYRLQKPSILKIKLHFVTHIFHAYGPLIQSRNLTDLKIIRSDICRVQINTLHIRDHLKWGLNITVYIAIFQKRIIPLPIS